MMLTYFLVIIALTVLGVLTLVVYPVLRFRRIISALVCLFVAVLFTLMYALSSRYAAVKQHHALLDASASALSVQEIAQVLRDPLQNRWQLLRFLVPLHHRLMHPLPTDTAVQQQTGWNLYSKIIESLAQAGLMSIDEAIHGAYRAYVVHPSAESGKRYIEITLKHKGQTSKIVFFLQQLVEKFPQHVELSALQVKLTQDVPESIAKDVMLTLDTRQWQQTPELFQQYAYLFVIVKQKGNAVPYAVKRMVLNQGLPAVIELTTADKMLAQAPNLTKHQVLAVKIRLSQSQHAIAQAEDKTWLFDVPVGQNIILPSMVDGLAD